MSALELLDAIDQPAPDVPALTAALRAVLDLHVPGQARWASDPKYKVCFCGDGMWPCVTVVAIEKALGGAE